MYLNVQKRRTRKENSKTRKHFEFSLDPELNAIQFLSKSGFENNYLNVIYSLK